MQELRLHDVCKSPINLLSRNRILTLMDKYPQEFMGKKVPEFKLEELGKKHNVDIWNGTGAIYGSKEEVKAKIKVIKRVLKGSGVKSLIFISETEINLGEKFGGILQWPVKKTLNLDISQLIGVVRGSYDILKGKPSEVSMKTPYWRLDGKIPEKNFNPARDNCGLFWFSPVMPFNGEKVMEALKLGKNIFEKYDLEMPETLTLSSGRSIESTIPILFNKNDPEQTKRAENCYFELIKEFAKIGLYPYRTGVSSMNLIVDNKDPYWKTVNKIKKALDPNHIISPGRYENA
ncbi:MAG: hypothetical protein KC550_06035 [Nanoarchaeota archaeon]|nr:hypothetical protein [Nanoarchaeota archaeon]